MRTLKLCVAAAATLFSAVSCFSVALAHDALTVGELRSAAQPSGLVENAAFLPPKDAAAAHEPFEGRLVLTETAMGTEPSAFKAETVLGKNPKIFPAVPLAFVTDGDDLVPIRQDVLRSGSLEEGRSYWDIIVQPGKVWSEPRDEGWSRASFPFSLMHSLEGETHNGVATFLYKGGEVSALRVQIVQQTSPYYIEDYFTAWGAVPAKLDGKAVAGADAVRTRFRAQMADQVPVKTWADLEAKVGADALKDFDSAIRLGELVVDGMVVDGEFYLRSCPSAAGELAYCDRQRFGVWSITKSAANGIALLHLAQKYGPSVYAEKLGTYIPEAASLPGWKDVTFDDAINMATGVGNGSTKTDPNEIGDGELDETYPQWYEARTEQEKVETILKIAKVYPWGPGKVARYRDQDMFMLGVAMDRFVKSKEGPSASLWQMLEDEVYGPIGIHYVPINKTIEKTGEGHPLMAFGFYPTLSDLVKIAGLYQSGGAHGGTQLLDRARLDKILDASQERGLPTGEARLPHYFSSFWIGDYKAAGGCSVKYPTMVGWGSNYVSLLPGGMVAIRLAKNWDGDDSAANLDSLLAVADRIKPLCP